eukprot:6534185-Prymnesium_polylepis.1
MAATSATLEWSRNADESGSRRYARIVSCREGAFARACHFGPRFRRRQKRSCARPVPWRVSWLRP